MTTLPSKTPYSWSFVPRLPDTTSYQNSPFKVTIHTLADVSENIGKQLKGNQIRGLVRFKTHHDLVKKIDASILNMDDEVCCQFTCQRHLDVIIQNCNKLNIPPAAIHSITLFDCGSFIH